MMLRDTSPMIIYFGWNSSTKLHIASSRLHAKERVKFNLSEWWALTRVSEFWLPQLEGVYVPVLHVQQSCSRMDNCADLHSDGGHRTGFHSDSEILHNKQWHAKQVIKHSIHTHFYSIIIPLASG